MINLLLQIAVTILVYVTIWFVYSLIQKRNDVADIAWGAGFVEQSLKATSKSHSLIWIKVVHLSIKTIVSFLKSV